MNSHSPGQPPQAAPPGTDDPLTQEQRAFADLLGRILAEQWERHKPCAADRQPLPDQMPHPEEGSNQVIPPGSD